MNDESNKGTFVSLCSLEGCKCTPYQVQSLKCMCNRILSAFHQPHRMAYTKLQEGALEVIGYLMFVPVCTTYVRVCLQYVCIIYVPVYHLDLFSALFCSTVRRKM